MDQDKQDNTLTIEEFDGLNMTKEEIIAFLIRNQGKLTIIKSDDPNWLEKTMEGVVTAEV